MDRFHLPMLRHRLMSSISISRTSRGNGSDLLRARVGNIRRLLRIAIHAVDKVLDAVEQQMLAIGRPLCGIKILVRYGCVVIPRLEQKIGALALAHPCVRQHAKRLVTSANLKRVTCPVRHTASNRCAAKDRHIYEQLTRLAPPATTHHYAGEGSTAPHANLALAWG